ncbi:hypothetical protein [Acuticoccus kandeliae]|uniref:hypothetical protein n=1 Tax=Acuticoccus kandeliae TaxID=2073160 RepID=UPI0013009275|nr:hypothetical protein [Acuticoccus kandeliae]
MPTAVPETTENGYPNVLSDPTTVGGLPRTARSVAAERNAMEAERTSTQASARRLASAGGPSTDLSQRARTHVEETRRAIEASGRQQDEGLSRLGDPAGAKGTNTASAMAAPPPTVAADPGRVLSPDEPQPRAVGVPPLQPASSADETVAPAE